MSKYLPFSHDNDLTLLYLGEAYFTALIAAIDAARREVVIETYIFEADGAGQNISAALQRAAQRGVSVRVITDGIGTSRRLPLVEDWRECGVMHRVYNPHLFGKFGFHARIASSPSSTMRSRLSAASTSSTTTTRAAACA